MSDRDPCQGCTHLRVLHWPRRPECALMAQYGDRHCQRRTVPRPTSDPLPNPPPNRGREWVGVESRGNQQQPQQPRRRG